MGADPAADEARDSDAGSVARSVTAQEAPLDAPRFDFSPEPSRPLTWRLLGVATASVALAAGGYQFFGPRAGAASEQLSVHSDSGIKVEGEGSGMP